MRIWAFWAGAVAAGVAGAALLLAPVSHADMDAFEKALAEIDQALEANPKGVSEDSLNSCRAMRKTAVLLHKMGKHARAVRRIQGCRRLLGLDEYRSEGSVEPRGVGG